MTAEEAISCQLGALRENDQPHPDYGIEVMYRVKVLNYWENVFLYIFILGRGMRKNLFHSCSVWISQFAGFDPFERSVYFGPSFDLGQVKHSDPFQILLL